MKEKRNWRSSQFYSPFGGGGRFCPGAELARLQIALFLHYFLTTYRSLSKLINSLLLIKINNLILVFKFNYNVSVFFY